MLTIGIDASRANQKQRTGVEEYSFQIIQHLKKVLPANVQVVLYSRDPLIDELGDLPSNWNSKVLKWFPFLWTQVRLSWEMLISPPDVLFIPSHVFPIIHPIRTVMTIHDIAAARFPKSYNQFERWYSLWSAKKALKDLYKIIVPTKFTKKELLDNFGRKYESKVNVVHHGVNKSYEQKSKNKKILEKYNLDSQYLINVGRIEHKKNTGNLIKAFEKLKQDKSFENLKLLLVGNKGYGGDRIHKQIKNSDISQDIIFSGWVEEEDLPHLISSAELMTYVSRYEGFGMPLLESFVCKTPVIASNIESLKEVGKDGPMYVDPSSITSISEGIKKMLTNQNFREQKIVKGSERLKFFSWKNSAKKTAEKLLS